MSETKIDTLKAKSEAYKKAFDVSENGDVSTDDGCCVLFSNFNIGRMPTLENSNAAEEYVKNNPNAKTIYQTEAGKKLREMKLWGRDSKLAPGEAYDLWKRPSERMIEQAKGNVVAFCKDCFDKSMFSTIELPLVLANENINTINGENKWSFEDLVTKNHDIYKEAKAKHELENPDWKKNKPRYMSTHHAKMNLPLDARTLKEKAGR